ncbi:ATP-binding cassette domain-containing protein [Halovulum dunhuangense]|uniref:ATP-binding cassette domain-containing protein n=1 Tax=Halovulum dunhuangense TaxID=1505036 RepID=A0A849KW07_9RHOB|nr:ATP-binding cassette domain-containing protein [Halovulum dunhuangense]
MISFEKASFAYGDRPVLTGVTQTLEPGGFYFLTGPSGSGKTTFLKLCTLAEIPQSGSARYFGEEAGTLDREGIARMRQRMGVVHQDCQFLDHLPLRRNIALPLELAGRRKPEHEGDIDDLMAWVGLSDRAEALPPELSGGERQRAALARAVILSPDILIADEPTGNIDKDMGRRILALLIELNRLGRTVLIATHDLELIRAAKAEISARVLRIAGGCITQAGAEL